MAAAQPEVEEAEDQAVGLVLGTMEFGRGPSQEESEKMVEMFLASNHFEIDTAFMYTSGKSEEMLGNMPFVQSGEALVATKANPWSATGLQPQRVKEQLKISLERLKLGSCDVFYLHAPDHKTPLQDTLKACDELYKEGKFKQLALSNYAAWQVVQAHYICKENDWIIPTIYQGMYNAVTRDVERELFPALRELNMSFYAYNPLAGGLLTGRYCWEDTEKKPEGRFFSSGGKWSETYRTRYWKKENFDALDGVNAAIKEKYGDEATPVDGALRWLMHHSKLDAAYGDKIILGASKIGHLEQNIAACKHGHLEPEVVKAYNEAWKSVQGNCPGYFR